MEYTVAAVDEALGLLIQVAEEPGLGVTELAKRSGNTKARSFRLLTTLEERGFVERYGASAVYRLGHKALIVGLAAREQISLVGQSVAHLAELGRLFNETAQVRVRDGLETVCIAIWESHHDVRVVAQIGRRRPLHAGSSGKLFLAFASEDTRQAVLASPLQRYTPNTIVQRSKLSQDLAKIRSQGYATSDSEMSENVLSISAPVRDSTGQMVAAIGMSVPSARVQDRMPKFISGVVAAAAALSAELGWRPSKADTPS